MTLYEISEHLKAIEEVLTETEGEIADDTAGEMLAEWFDQLTDQRDAKIDSYCRLIAELGARAEARRAEILRLGALVDAGDRAVTRLKNALKAFLDAHNLTRLETASFKLTVAKNGGKAPLVIPDAWREDAVNAPEAYHRTYVKLDAEAIRADLEAGQTVEGCAIGDRGTHLRIR